MNQPPFPLGKLPADLMAELLAAVPVSDAGVVLGPGPGLDCAVLDPGGDKLLVLKSDPITFTAGDLGWYLVQVNANDIASTGATPRWLLATLLLPEAETTEEMVRTIFSQLLEACSSSGITLIGGHTEVTQGLDRPVAVGTMIGDVPRNQLLTPRGARPGDVLLLTKFIPIEAVAILCQEFPDKLSDLLSKEEIELGAAFHRQPGISVLRDAQIARSFGSVSAMHDPTEGGLASAVWELSEASNRRIVLDVDAVPIHPLARQICRYFGIDPLAAISSGALLLTVPQADQEKVCQALREQSISCTAIGRVEVGTPGVWSHSEADQQPLARPKRDEIARLYDRFRPPA